MASSSRYDRSPWSSIQSVKTRSTAARVPRDLNLFHGTQVLVRAYAQLLELLAEYGHLVGHVDATSVGQVQELVDLILDLDDVPFEI